VAHARAKAAADKAEAVAAEMQQQEEAADDAFVGDSLKALRGFDPELAREAEVSARYVECLKNVCKWR
jgi:hypothetical protein